MLTLRLTPATASDLDWLTELFLITMQPTTTAARGAWNPQREEAQFRAQLRLADTKMILIRHDKVGFITVVPISPGRNEVHTLCVKTDLQGAGIGTRVLRELMSAARAGEVIELSVLKTNNRAQVLYERLGFEITSTTEYHRRMRWVSSGRAEINPNDPYPH